MRSKDNVFLICVLFYPSKSCINKWAKYTSEFQNSVYIDNTPSEDIDYTPPFTNYIKIGKNIGIGAAQNIGIQLAKKLGAKYVVFFDQDSTPEIKTIYKLKDEFYEIENNGVKIGAIGPRIINENQNKLYKSYIVNDDSPMDVDCIISSGMLTSIRNLEVIGNMDEKLFIDYVDFEWCWRAKSKGYSVFIANDCFLKHSVGKKTLSFFKIPFIISSPFRYFYQYRNFIWLSRTNTPPHSND